MMMKKLHLCASCEPLMNLSSTGVFMCSPTWSKVCEKHPISKICGKTMCKHDHT